jgi:hypothetical protein
MRNKSYQEKERFEKRSNSSIKSMLLIIEFLMANVMCE